MPVLVKSIQPNGVSASGLFSWAFSTPNSFTNSIYLSGYPNSDTSLTSAIDSTYGTRFLPKLTNLELEYILIIILLNYRIILFIFGINIVLLRIGL